MNGVFQCLSIPLKSTTTRAIWVLKCLNLVGLPPSLHIQHATKIKITGILFFSLHPILNSLVYRCVQWQPHHLGTFRLGSVRMACSSAIIGVIFGWIKDRSGKDLFFNLARISWRFRSFCCCGLTHLKRKVKTESPY